MDLLTHEELRFARHFFRLRKLGLSRIEARLLAELLIGWTKTVETT